MLESNSAPEVALFVLIHMATVDGSVHPNEMEVIRLRSKELFPLLDNPDQVITDLVARIQKLGSTASNEWIEQNIASLGQLTPALRQSLYHFLFEVINADGRVREEETRTLRMLKSALTGV